MQFGKVQLRIMHVLWDKGRCSAREITETLNKKERIAHSTVQTLLRTLEDKGAISHDVDYRTFIFYPLVEKDDVIEYALNNFVDQLFAGSTTGMVSYLVKNEMLSKNELDSISELIDNAT